MPDSTILTKNTAKKVEQISTCTLEQLLEIVPIHSERRIDSPYTSSEHGFVEWPKDIWMHCEGPKCEGTRRLNKADDGVFKLASQQFYHYVAYICSNCRQHFKVFAVKTKKENHVNAAICTKIYQEPAFGQPTPKRLFKIIGETNREYFLQARRATARGLGIGAYAYYRRIVENTKFDLVASVLEVAEATSAPPAQIALLKKAQAENQFSKAIGMLREVSAIPATLLIDGHNPLSLLHDLLSEGIHDLDDAKCLKRSQEAEIILFEIAERLQSALTERKTVKETITSIMRRKQIESS